MPLLHDMARCQGEKELPSNRTQLCIRRNHCARYVERNQGGPRTMKYWYLCSEGDDNYIPVKPDGKTTENL